jgi:hypothetical protein
MSVKGTAGVTGVVGNGVPVPPILSGVEEEQEIKKLIQDSMLRKIFILIK